MVAFLKRVFCASVAVYLFGTLAGFSDTKEVRKESARQDSPVTILATVTPSGVSPTNKLNRTKRSASNTERIPTIVPTIDPTRTPTSLPTRIPVSVPTQRVASVASPSAISSPTAIQSASADPVDTIFAAVQQHWKQPAMNGAGGDQNNTEGGKGNANEVNLPLADNPSLMRSVGQMLISLAFVILLGISTAWFFRRYFLKKHTLGGNYIEWLGSYSLSPKSKVHLIRVGGDHLLIGEGNNSVSLISKVEISPDSLSTPTPVPISLPLEIDESLPPDSQYANAGFQTQLAQWQNSLENQGLRQEVNASLLFLKGLTQRLRKKGERNA